MSFENFDGYNFENKFEPKKKLKNISYGTMLKEHKFILN